MRNKPVYQSTVFAVLAMLLACSIFLVRVEAEDSLHEQGENTMSDFSFLRNMRVIHHRRLKESMAGSDEWTTFQTEYEAWDMLDGAASIDKVSGQIDGKPFEGVSVRTFDKDSNTWTIYWMDIWNTSLREQVKGQFDSDVGTFYGTEEYRGVTYRMRFLWKDITDTSARWEQAYQHPETGDWETNWIMDFYASDE